MDFKKWLEMVDPATGQKIPSTERLNYIKQRFYGKGYFGSFTERFGDVKQRSPMGYKLGLNPKSEFDTPIGIYCYPMDYIIDQNISGVPFAADKPAIIVFKPKPNANVLFMHTGGGPDYLDYLTEDEIDYIDRKMRYLGYSQRSNTSFLWLGLKILADEHRNQMRPMVEKNAAVLWTKECLKRGIHGFVDEGTGTIHTSEPTQAVFFTTGAIDVIDAIDNVWSGSGSASRIEHRANKLFNHLASQIKKGKRDHNAEKALIGYDNILANHPDDDVRGNSGLSYAFAKKIVERMHKNFLVKKSPEHVGTALRQYLGNDIVSHYGKDPYIKAGGFDPQTLAQDLKKGASIQHASVQMAYSRLLNDTYRRFKATGNIESTLLWMDNAIEEYIDIAIEKDQERYRDISPTSNDQWLSANYLELPGKPPIIAFDQALMNFGDANTFTKLVDGIFQKQPWLQKHAPNRDQFDNDEQYRQAMIKFLKFEKDKSDRIHLQLFVPTLICYQIDSIAGELHKKQPSVMKGAPWRSQFPNFAAYHRALVYYFDRLGYNVPDPAADPNILSYEFNKKVLETLAKKIAGREWWKPDKDPVVPAPKKGPPGFGLQKSPGI